MNADRPNAGDFGHAECIENSFLACRERRCVWRIQIDVVGCVHSQCHAEFFRGFANIDHALLVLRDSLHPLQFHCGDAEFRGMLQSLQRPTGLRCGERNAGNSKMQHCIECTGNRGILSLCRFPATSLTVSLQRLTARQRTGLQKS